MTKKLDEIDYAILKILLVDSRTSYRQIKEQLGISIGTIFNRIGKLKKAGIILKFTLDFDYSKVDSTRLFNGKVFSCFSCIHHPVCELFNKLNIEKKRNKQNNLFLVEKFLGIDFYELSKNCNLFNPIINQHETPISRLLKGGKEV